MTFRFTFSDPYFLTHTSATNTDIQESFEYSDGWPGTVADVLYPYTFNFDSEGSIVIQDSFESNEGW